MPQPSDPSPGRIASAPLRSYDDLAGAMHRLLAPLERFRTPGKARIELPGPSAHYSRRIVGLEGFARPLWALAAAAKGGVPGVNFEPWLEGLAAGCDPAHAEFWGRTLDDKPYQITVEAAAIGFALAMAPKVFWDPLPQPAKQNLARWLAAARGREVIDNNWHFFPILIDLGLRAVGMAGDPDKTAEHFTAIERHYAGGGWYRDGGRCFDHYNAFAFHFYGLAYAALAGDEDRARAAEFRERAAAFAETYQYWFGADGAAVPFGRSLTYRFAQAGFWGMLAAANVEALPWARIKGLYLRNLDWWFARPILDSGGILTVGYAYPSLFASDEYNSAASSYWAMKGMIGLAAGPAHPFWRTEPEDPRDLPDGIRADKAAGVVVSRWGGDVTMLTNGQEAPPVRQAAAKYGKMAYSSRFGFCTESGCQTLEQAAPDNTVALWRSDGGIRVRDKPEAVVIGADWLYSRWKPWRDTAVETWLLARGPYHLRAHLIACPESFVSIEGGFAIPIPDDDDFVPANEGKFPTGLARIAAGNAESGIVDLKAQRMGLLLSPLPNTNVHFPRTVIPVLRGVHDPGNLILMTRVWGRSGTVPQIRAADAGADRAALEEIIRRTRS